VVGVGPGDYKPYPGGRSKIDLTDEPQ